jgi:hypothetical protein
LILIIMVEYNLQTGVIIYLVAESVVAVLVVVGNGIVLVAIAHYRQLQTITNIFIASLAAADLCVGLVQVPVALLPELDGQPHDFYGCVLLNCSIIVFTNISTLGLLGVALERFLAIAAPLQYHNIVSKKKVVALNVALWVAGTMIGLIPLLDPMSQITVDGVFYCLFRNVVKDKLMVQIFYLFYSPILVFILGVYAYIYYVLRSQRSRILASRPSTISTISTLQDRQVAQLSRLEKRSSQRFMRKRRLDLQGAKWLFIVVVLFVGCWLPIRVMDSIRYHDATKHLWLDLPQTNQLAWLYTVIVLSHVNSAVNPVLYAFSNSKIKRAMLRIVDKCVGTHFVLLDPGVTSSLRFTSSVYPSSSHKSSFTQSRVQMQARSASTVSQIHTSTHPHLQVESTC